MLPIYQSCRHQSSDDRLRTQRGVICIDISLCVVGTIVSNSGRLSSLAGQYNRDPACPFPSASIPVPEGCTTPKIKVVSSETVFHEGCLQVLMRWGWLCWGGSFVDVTTHMGPYKSVGLCLARRLSQPPHFCIRWGMSSHWISRILIRLNAK